MIWTGDYLDVARRLQAAVISPALATVGQTADGRIIPPLPRRFLARLRLSGSPRTVSRSTAPLSRADPSTRDRIQKDAGRRGDEGEPNPGACPPFIHNET